jgi:hypothetical protein
MNIAEWGETYNWNDLNDSEIARLSGKSRERVRQVREELGLPKSVNFHQPSKSAKMKILAGDWSGKLLGDVADEVGCSKEYAKKCLIILKKDYIKPPDGRCQHKYDWDSITAEEWQTLTSTEIAQKLGVKNPAVVSQWRRRRNIRKRSAVVLAEVAG